MWACFRFHIKRSCPLREGVTPDGGSEVPVPAGQEDKVVEQMASSGRGGAELAQGEWADFGWAEKRKRRGSQPDTWKYLLPKVEVIFRDTKQAE